MNTVRKEVDRREAGSGIILHAFLGNLDVFAITDAVNQDVSPARLRVWVLQPQAHQIWSKFEQFSSLVCRQLEFFKRLERGQAEEPPRGLNASGSRVRTFLSRLFVRLAIIRVPEAEKVLDADSSPQMGENQAFWYPRLRRIFNQFIRWSTATEHHQAEVDPHKMTMDFKIKDLSERNAP